MVAFGVFMWGLIFAFQLIVEITRSQQRETQAMAIASERMEVVRNMPYDDVGVEGGIPQGTLPNVETIVGGRIDYIVLYDVRYVDDPFDGTMGNGDALPTDYKKVRVEVGVGTPDDIQYSVVLVSNVVPPGLESNAGGGSLLVQVFNSVNDPVQGAEVHLENANLPEPIDVIGLTNSDGEYAVLGAPASTESYRVTVSKTSYSSSQTYDTTVQNPNPNPAHMSVFDGLLTAKSFFIDRLSTLNVRTFDDLGLSVAWWDHHYTRRAGLTIENNGSVDLPAGTVLSVSMDHAALVTAAQSLASGDDVRVVYNAGAGWSEMDRVASQEGWNQPATKLWFRLSETIPVGETNTHYAIYYNRADGVNPPTTLAEIFAPDANDVTAVWYAEDGTGTTFSDSGSGSHHATLQNMDDGAWGAGKHAGGIQWDGADDCAVVPDHPDLSPNGPFTIEAWVYLVAGTPTSTIIEKGNGLVHPYSFGIQTVGAAKALRFTYEDSGIDVTVFHPNPIPMGTWQHVAAAVSETDVILYVDGVASIPVPIVASPQPSAQDVTIGCDDQNRHYLGGLDGLALIPEARTAFPSSLQTFGSGLNAPESFSTGGPLSSIAFTLTGDKPIGTDALGVPISKTVISGATDTAGLYQKTDTEYDTYDIALNGDATGYDIAGSLPHLPVVVDAGATSDVSLFLSPHADHTLLVSVEDPQGTPVVGATVRLQHAPSGYDQTVSTSFTGQSFFSPLSVFQYSLTISAQGYETQTFPLDIAGQTVHTIQLATQ